MADIQRIETGRLQANCYVVSAPNGDAVVVDPGDQFDLIEATIAVRAIGIRAVLCTHAHFDHLGAAVAVCERYEVPFHLHDDDAALLRRASFTRRITGHGDSFPIPPIDVSLADGMTLLFGELEVKVVHTPGHSPGAVCFEVDGVLFTGDMIGSEGLGRTDLPGGSTEAMWASFLRLTRDYAPSTALYPGHGLPVRLGDLSSGIGAQQSTARSQPGDG
jgi:hydroxyacylglutathione hydrolase